MRFLLLFVALATLLGSCGDQVVYRQLNLDIQGMSGRADRLVVMIFPESTGTLCVHVDLSSVQELSSDLTTIWRREDGEHRTLSFEKVESEKITVVAYSEDEGMPIQVGCVEVDYLQIESPDVSLKLSDRV